jgi:hypothetical protein
VPELSVAVATAWVVSSAGALTVKVKLLNEICGLGVVLSVTVTMNVVADNRAVGVPEIWPVLELNVSPLGNVGLTA